MILNVLMISPGYPAEMPEFTKGLAAVGARVYGVGDQPEESLPKDVRLCINGYLQVRSLWDEDGVIAAVNRWKGMATIHHVACLWEPGMMMAARLREALDTPGLTVEQTIPFRDKEEMKKVLDKAGLRTPRHRDASTVSGIWEAAEEIGYPLIVKPIDGAGSADTYRIDNSDELRGILSKLSHVHRVSVEEFIDGEEYTYDTICIGGKIAYSNIAWYRPRPLIARSREWVSPQVIALRDLTDPILADGIAMGESVIKSLGFKDGFTHMEWYRKADGEVVFGEIGARPPGAHQVDQMNFACNIDTYKAWAEAICHGRWSENTKRLFNVATIYKRAHGHGIIQRFDGYQEIKDRFGEHIIWDSLLPVGSRRRNWRATLVSDGFIMLRHPDLETTLAMADEVANNLNIYAS